ncbi:hypothetical protein GA0115246_106135, partial [Streptomyces sp. SolWspMP-sol7th]
MLETGTGPIDGAVYVPASARTVRWGRLP